MIQSAPNAAERALKDKIAERNNWERNQADAMRRDYDAVYVGRIQFTLNQLYKEIGELEKSIEQHRRNVQSISHDISTIHAAIRKLDPLRENLQTADWSAKQKWLYLLGITVHIYHRGIYDDGYGNPWEIRHNGRGLKEIVGDLQNDDPFMSNTSSRVNSRVLGE